MENEIRFWTDRIRSISNPEDHRDYGIKSACLEIDIHNQEYIDEINKLKNEIESLSDDVQCLQAIKQELEDKVAECFYKNHKFPE